MTQTYDKMREQMELQEVSLGRAGSTLFFAAQVRNDGKRLEQNISKAKGSFEKSQRAKTMEEKFDHMAEGMTEVSNAIYLQRRMMGHLTGLGLSAALTNEKSDKKMQQLLKGKGRR